MHVSKLHTLSAVLQQLIGIQWNTGIITFSLFLSFRGKKGKKFSKMYAEYVHVLFFFIFIYLPVINRKI